MKTIEQCFSVVPLVLIFFANRNFISLSILTVRGYVTGILLCSGQFCAKIVA